jgi:Domain of unknown function (DUF4833)
MSGKNRHLLAMLQRRSVAGLVGLAAVGWAFPSNASSPVASTLFTIARSKNRNIVRYVARSHEHDLDQLRPIEAHWLMRAEDGRREELSWAERRLAYGFQVSRLRADSCALGLVAFKQRLILVQRHADGFRALVTIAGQRASLERIFVQTDESALLPSVQYLELFGIGLDGTALSERIVAR